MPLCSDGLTISNEFDLTQKDNIQRLPWLKVMIKLKPINRAL
jgi:hypothetical protein